MFNILKNVTKAAVAVAVTPVTLAADLAMMPADAAEGKDFANRTAKKLRQAGRALDAAVDLEGESR